MKEVQQAAAQAARKAYPINSVAEDLGLPSPSWEPYEKGFLAGHAYAGEGMKFLSQRLPAPDSSGWLFDYKYLKDLTYKANRLNDHSISMEEVETVLLTLIDESPSDAVESEAVAKPKVICLCGSLRVALEAFKQAEYECLMRGDVALLPCRMFVDIEREYGLSSEYKMKADEQHKRKIDMCDEVHVLNVGGYIGESTRSEINYALSINKPITYLENHNK